MTSIPEHVPSIASVPRVRLLAVAVAFFVVVAAAFFAGRITAPNAGARVTSVRPVHLTASLQSADGRRRAQVMRKMNELARGDGSGERT
jgi:hypothetical protein